MLRLITHQRMSRRMSRGICAGVPDREPQHMRWFRPTLDRRGGNGRARRAWCAARAIAARSCKTASPSPKSSSKSISPHFACRKHGSVERSRECDTPSRAELDLVPLCLTPADPRVRQLRLDVKGDPSATRHRSTTRQERRLPPRASSSSDPRVRPFRRFVLEGGGRSVLARDTASSLSRETPPPPRARRSARRSARRGASATCCAAPRPRAALDCSAAAASGPVGAARRVSREPSAAPRATLFVEPGGEGAYHAGWQGDTHVETEFPRSQRPQSQSRPRFATRAEAYRTISQRPPTTLNTTVARPGRARETKTARAARAARAFTAVSRPRTTSDGAPSDGTFGGGVIDRAAAGDGGFLAVAAVCSATS